VQAEKEKPYLPASCFYKLGQISKGGIVMAKVTVVKQENFTVIDNGIFKDTRLSFKAKGILTTMLSLPPTWNYTIEGLRTLAKDGKDSIKTALKELEKFGYLERKQVRNDDGSFCDLEYFVYEKPQAKEPKAENPPTDKSLSENPPQLNTNISSTNKSNTELLSTDKLSIDKEKGENINKVNEQVKTSVSEKKPMRTQKSAKQRYLDKKADEFEMLNSILLICSSNYDEQIGNEIFKSLEYYFERYTKKTGLIHPILKMETLEDIIDKMANYSDTEYYHFDNIAEQEGAFIKIIDAFFDGDFGSVTGQRTNWHLPHFMSDGVLDRLAQRVWEQGEIM